MPAKSRHGKGRRPQNKNRAGRPQIATVNQSAATVPVTPTPAPAKAAAVSKASIYTPFTKAEYPFFTSELKRITIITATILVVLVILAFIIK